MVLGRIELELLHNQEGAKKLQEALAQSSSARADLWEWAITIVDSFSFAAHEDLVASGLQRLLPQKLEDSLYGSYRELDDLLHQVKQAAAALRFFYGYSSDAEKRSNQQLNEIRDFSQDITIRLDSTIEMLKSERADRNLA